MSYSGCYYLLSLKNMKWSRIIRLIVVMDSFLDVVNYDMLRIYSDSRALKDDLDNNSNLIMSI